MGWLDVLIEEGKEATDVPAPDTSIPAQADTSVGAAPPRPPGRSAGQEARAQGMRGQEASVEAGEAPPVREPLPSPPSGALTGPGLRPSALEVGTGGPIPSRPEVDEWFALQRRLASARAIAPEEPQVGGAPLDVPGPEGTIVSGEADNNRMLAFLDELVQSMPEQKLAKDIVLREAGATGLPLRKVYEQLVQVNPSEAEMIELLRGQAGTLSSFLPGRPGVLPSSYTGGGQVPDVLGTRSGGGVSDFTKALREGAARKAISAGQAGQRYVRTPPPAAPLSAERAADRQRLLDAGYSEADVAAIYGF